MPPYMKSKRPVSSRKAVVLLSGGLDSAVTLFYARRAGYLCECLSFDYGQRHRKELRAAEDIASYAGCSHSVVKISLPWKGSSLLDGVVPLPGPGDARDKIPSTYVPGRNIIFLSFAVSCAEASGSGAVFIGANAVDYSGYPDCRPEFYDAFGKAVKAGTKTGAQGRRVKIETPLISMSKSRIVRLGARLGVPFGLTWSCYAGGTRPCGKCESCFYRAKGFREAGVDDPALARRT